MTTYRFHNGQIEAMAHGLATPVLEPLAAAQFWYRAYVAAKRAGQDVLAETYRQSGVSLLHACTARRNERENIINLNSRRA